MSEELIAAIEAPRGTTPLIGHDVAVQSFLQSWHGGRLAHGWLISGPPGIGKATLAWHIARFVLAGGHGGEGEGGLAVDPDNPAARQLAAGAHPDCRLVRRSINPNAAPPRLRTEISVADVRALAPFLHQTAALGGWRVVVVDAADEMNPNAANALLKLLEEPPPQALLLLVSHAPNRLLPTIRSRCRHLPLRPLNAAQLETVVRRQWPAAVELPAAEQAALAGLADGSPGRALALLEGGGLASYRQLLTLLETLPDLDLLKLLKTADGFAGAKGEGPYRTFSDLLRWWLVSLIRGAATDHDASVLPEERPLRARLLSRGLAPWLAVWEKADTLFARADGANLDRKQVVLNVFFALADAARA